MEVPSFVDILTGQVPVTDRLLINLPLNDLLNLCQTNPNINNLCHQDYIWRERTRLEFPEDFQNIPPNTSWEAYYINLYLTVPVKIYRNNTLFESFRISRRDIRNFEPTLSGTGVIIYTDKNKNAVAFVSNEGGYPLVTPMNIDRIYVFPSTNNQNLIDTIAIYQTLSDIYNPNRSTAFTLGGQYYVLDYNAMMRANKQTRDFLTNFLALI